MTRFFICITVLLSLCSCPEPHQTPLHQPKAVYVDLDPYSGTVNRTLKFFAQRLESDGYRMVSKEEASLSPISIYLVTGTITRTPAFDAAHACRAYAFAQEMRHRLVLVVLANENILSNWNKKPEKTHFEALDSHCMISIDTVYLRQLGDDPIPKSDWDSFRNEILEKTRPWCLETGNCDDSWLNY